MAYDFMCPLWQRALRGENVNPQREWQNFLATNPDLPALDEDQVIFRSALAGLGVLSLPSFVVPWLTWRWAKRRADRGHPSAMRWFRRARIAGIVTGVAALSVEIYTANHVINQTRVLQRRWREAVLRQRQNDL